MAKILIARGQATIYVQKDGYTITQSLGEYVFPADDTGKILSSVTLTSTVRVMCGDEERIVEEYGKYVLPEFQ